jgi:hypothetical protein
MGSLSFAIDMSACSRLLNDGLFRKYNYMGIDQPATKATKQLGTTKGTTAMTGERTTASFDPKYWTNVSSSGFQGTTSTGECALLGLKELKEQRELYFAQNKTEIMEDLARGAGESLNVLALYSLCEESSYKTYSKELRTKISELQSSSDLGSISDQVVEENPELAKSCYSHRS